jgi:energy-coupling factor transporter transmembrane protein EcfT
MNIKPKSWSRFWVCIIATAGAIVTNDPTVVGAGYLIIIVPALILGGVLKIHCKFLVGIVTPVALLNFFVWPILMGAPPGHVAGSDPQGGFYFASVTVFRLMFIGGVVQAFIISIPAEDFPAALHQLGVRNEWLIIILGSKVLGPEMVRQANRVYTAVLARGLLPNRSIWNRIKIMPTMIVPLVVWSLRSAIHRADNWHERKFLDRINKLTDKNDEGSFSISIMIILLSIFWFILTCLIRWGKL